MLLCWGCTSCTMQPTQARHSIHVPLSCLS
jgi:hypothetical protein